MSEGTDERADRATSLTVARRSVALAVAVLAFIVWTTSHVFEWPTICRERLATIGDDPTVQLCGPMEAESLLGAVLLIAILLLPDVSELAIPNLITLKRRVESQGEEQQRLRDDVARIEQVQVAQQNVNVNVPAYVPPDWDRVKEDFQQTIDDAKELVTNLRRVASSAPPPGDPHGGREQLEMELLRLWRPIERLMTLRHARRRGPLVRDSRASAEELEAILEFQRVFATELQAVRVVRNGVVHEPERVSSEDLREAIEVAKRLNDALTSFPEVPRS